MFTENWAATYSGFPKTLHFDQESSFMSAKMAKHGESKGVALSVSGLESHDSLSTGKPYHRELRGSFSCYRAKLPTIKPADDLRLAIKGINDTAGTKSLVTSSLVLGTVPSFSSSPKHHKAEHKRFEALKNLWLKCHKS